MLLSLSLSFYIYVHRLLHSFPPLLLLLLLSALNLPTPSLNPEAMDKFQKSQIAKLCLLVLFFLITPLLSTSMRPPYLYFLLNLLIIVLGAEAGLLSFLKPLEEKKPVLVAAPMPIVMTTGVLETSPDKVTSALTRKTETAPDKVVVSNTNKVLGNSKKMVEKSVSAKIVSVTKVCTVNKCPSMPSLFFIGGDAEEEEFEEEEEEELESLSKQELFTKAEIFIGNFYNQLKIQREDSFKKLHDFYHKAF